MKLIPRWAWILARDWLLMSWPAGRWMPAADLWYRCDGCGQWWSHDFVGGAAGVKHEPPHELRGLCDECHGRSLAEGRRRGIGL